MQAKIHAWFLEEYTITKVKDENKNKKPNALGSVIKDSKFANGKNHLIKVSPINITPAKVNDWMKAKNVNFEI